MTMTQVPQAAPPAPQYRPRLWLWIVLGIVVASAISALVWAYPPSSPVPASSTHTVVYTTEADGYTGSGRTGMVTAQTPGGGSAQQTGLLPITGTFPFHSGEFVYVSVQNQQPAGSVTCRITVDGVVVSENTSSGGYTIATCQGSVPR